MPISLTTEERTQLLTLTKKGTHKAREITRAHVLLKCDAGSTYSTIATEEHLDRGTVRDICARYTESGIDRALYDAPRSGQPRKLSAKAEAYLVALACTKAPNGHDHWTLELLQEELIKKKKVQQISTVTLWHRLNAHDLKPWREKNVVHAEADC